jgi:serine/threonine protein kinase
VSHQTDLKAANVAITQRAEVKLIDFGLSVDLSLYPNDEMPARLPLAGSSLWLSPEAIIGQPVGVSHDIWSFGVFVWEMRGVRATNPLRSMFDVAVSGDPLASEPEKRKKLSKPLESFVSGAFEFRARQRTTAAQLLSHPFLKCEASQKEMEQFCTGMVVAKEVQFM